MSASGDSTHTDRAAYAQTNTAADAQTDTAADASIHTAADAQTHTAADAQTDTAAHAQTDTAAHAQTDIDPAELAEWMARDADLQVIDVREPYERAAGHIAGSRHIPLLELSSRAGEIARERPVVLYCRVGTRSDMAAQALRAAGVRALSMRGGLVRWASENRPLSPAGGVVADH